MSATATASAPHTALSRLYATHHAWLQGWLRRRLGCAFDADDVAQDTFMRLLKSDAAATLREPKDFLVTVAKRVMVDLFRRRTLERAYLEMLALIPDGYAPSPEQRQSLLESLQQIDAMLDGLGPKVKQAFLLSQLEGLGYADIAVRLSVSISSVKNTWPRPPSIACCSAWKTTFSHEQRHHPRAAPGAEDGRTLVCPAVR